MATETDPSAIRSVRPTDLDHCVTLRGVGWQGYRQILRIRGEAPSPRMVYLDGDLRLMSPGHLHERDKEKLGAMVLVLAEELNLPLLMAGSTTYRRRKKEAGVEPDQSYYLARANLVRNRDRIDLRTDPPPDLTIEVVYSHSAAGAVEVSRRLGVPEVWVCDENSVQILSLEADRRYAEARTSRSFPGLEASEILDWLRRPEEPGTSDIDWLKNLRRWVREVVVPRMPPSGL